MNPIEVAKLRQSSGQLRGLLRLTRRDNAHLRELLRRAATYLAVVADDDEIRMELPELSVFVAHIREVCRETDGIDRNAHAGPPRRP